MISGSVWGFRAEVRNLLRRLRRVSKGAAEFEDIRPAAQLTAMPIEQALREAAPSDRAPPSIIVARVEALRHELETLHTDSDERRITLLLLRLAEEKQVSDMQFIWLTIFGSQLDALEAMAARKAKLDLNPYYSVHIDRYAVFAANKESPAPALNFDTWAAFLLNTGIAGLTEGQGQITEKGLALLALSNQRNFPKFQLF